MSRGEVDSYALLEDGFECGAMRRSGKLAKGLLRFFCMQGKKLECFLLGRALLNERDCFVKVFVLRSAFFENISQVVLLFVRKIAECQENDNIAQLMLANILAARFSGVCSVQVKNVV